MATQYIVLSGREGAEDLNRVLDKLTLPNPVSISYRHTGTYIDEALAEPLVAALKRSGVKEVATLFAEGHQVDQLRSLGLNHGITVSES